ncbi:Hypothetical protein HVR_LOCUS1084 [uncultured virus]|nr:Hypothetical protein HVR_LOCUS1084 [uncultured virus]
MALYTSDVDAIYDKIRDKIISEDIVRVLSSPRPQSLQLLADFPNIEEIMCTIICPLEKVDLIGDLILQRHKLIGASFTIFIPASDSVQQKDSQTKHSSAESNTQTKHSSAESNTQTKHSYVRKNQRNKRRRLINHTPYERLVKISIPTIIKKLGIRMRYLNIRFNIADEDTKSITLILLNKGLFCSFSSRGTSNCEMGLVINENKHSRSSGSKDLERIFQALVSTQSLRGLTTKGDYKYNLDKINNIPELTIIARRDTEDEPINQTYLRRLTSKAEIIDVIYSPDTIKDNDIYSEIIRLGSSGSLKQIKAIVPVSDVEDHILINKNLEEIHVLIRHMDDVEDMKVILENHKDRPIFYTIHYHRYSDNEYWLALQNSDCDIAFKDIIRTLMS